MTVIKDPGNDPNSYSDGLSRDWKTTAGLWKTDARDLIGTIAGLATPGWVSGQLWHTSANQWQSKDATDLANYNNEVTLYNNALSPAAADEIVATTINTGLNGGGSGLTNADELLRITVDRTGLWAFAAFVQAGDSGDGSTVWLTIVSAGTTLASTTFGFTPNAFSASGGSGLFVSPTLLTSGAVVSLYGVKDGSQQIPAVANQGLRGWFIPTQAHPH